LPPIVKNFLWLSTEKTSNPCSLFSTLPLVPPGLKLKLGDPSIPGSLSKKSNGLSWGGSGIGRKNPLFWSLILLNPVLKGAPWLFWAIFILVLPNPTFELGPPLYDNISPDKEETVSGGFRGLIVN
jgi:hypothetical protein